MNWREMKSNSKLTQKMNTVWNLHPGRYIRRYILSSFLVELMHHFGFTGGRTCNFHAALVQILMSLPNTLVIQASREVGINCAFSTLISYTPAPFKTSQGNQPVTKTKVSIWNLRVSALTWNFNVFSRNGIPVAIEIWIFFSLSLHVIAMCYTILFEVTRFRNFLQKSSRNFYYSKKFQTAKQIYNLSRGPEIPIRKSKSQKKPTIIIICCHSPLFD